MRCTVGPTGIGRVMGGRRSRMAGGLRAGSSHIVTRVTTRVCCSTSSDSVRRPIRCRRKVIAPIARPISGGKSTIANCCTQARSLRISSRICGSIFTASATNSCVSTIATTSRTAGMRLRAAGIRDSQSHELRRLRGTLLGVHGMRRTRLDETDGERRRTRVLRLCGSRGAVRS